jgi:hypothetical protein
LEIVTKFPGNLPDDFWRQKAIREFGVSTDFFNRFKDFCCSAQERYLQIANNYSLVEPDSLISTWEQLKFSAANEDQFTFLKLWKKSGFKHVKVNSFREACSVPREKSSYTLAKIALNYENIKVYQFLEVDDIALSQTTSEIICQEFPKPKDLNLARRVLTSHLGCLNIFDSQGDLVNVDENNHNLVCEILIRSLGSKYAKKSEVAYNFYLNNSIKEYDHFTYEIIPALLSVRHPFAKQALKDNMSVIEEYIEEHFEREKEREEDENEQDDYSDLPVKEDYMRWALKSLDKERVQFLLDKGLFLDIDYFYDLIDYHKSLTVEKLEIIEHFLNLGFEPYFRYQDPEAADELCPGFSDGSLQSLASEFVKNGDLDLFWQIYTSFPKVFDLESLSRDALDSEQFFVSRCLEKIHTKRQEKNSQSI